MIEKDKISFPCVVVDIETTGLSFTNNEIIEIGAIRYEIDGSKTTFSKFIKPIEKVPLFIYKLTKIKENDIREADKAKTVLKQFLDFINDDDILLCHNSEFDIKFLNYHLHKNSLSDIKNPILDTLVLSRIFLPFLNSHKLTNIAEYFQIKTENIHRAIFDAEITGLILQKITDFIINFVKPDEINFLVTLAEFCNKPEMGTNRFSYKTTNDYLLPYMTLLRDHMIKHALKRSAFDKSPFAFKHYNYIENKAEKEIDPSIDAIFKQNGMFQKSFENYELRQGQIDMSKSILDAFIKEEYLIVEAGTGVGKSLAYLVPSLLFSQKTKKKIVVSTNTKNLQEQLLFKDLPLIMKAIDLSFLAVLVKGRDNYLCMRKWQEIYESFILKQANNPFSPSEAKGLLYLFLWAINTKTGDITENQSFHNSKYSYIWKRLSSDRHLCLGRKCRFFSKCFLMEVRQKAEKANLLIINHSLLFSDFQNEQPTLGEIDYLIFDEAHNLLHSAPGYLGFSISFPDVIGFLNTIFAIRNDFQYGMIVNLKNSVLKSIIRDEEKEGLIKSIEKLTDYMKDSKEIVELPFRLSGEIVKQKGAYNKLRIKHHDKLEQWVGALVALQTYLNKVLSELKSIHGRIMLYESKQFHDQDTMLEFLEKTTENINQLARNIEELIDPELSKYAYWLSSLDIQTENFPIGVFNYAPIQVNDILPDIIYRKIKSLIFTSATLSLKNGFKFFKSSMGLDKFEKDKSQDWSRIVLEQTVLSPFDYDRQSLILNTEFLPHISDAYFMPQSRDLIKTILSENKVGTLILFTAKKDLEMIYDGIEQVCYENDILLLAQKGASGRGNILNQFIHDGKAVLLGTNSFWEGVDVQGESLELLILHKLPFQAPTEPIVEALHEKLEREGKNSFMHYSLPIALLRMRQGIGRLIRSKTDRGVILILDNRISTKFYGQYFKDIIPANIYSTKNPAETIDLITKKLKIKNMTDFIGG